MFYERQILATLACLYTLSLGLFALLQNRHNKLNQSFAAYNFCLGLWNISDLVILFPHPQGLWFLRIFGIPSAFMIPFVTSFTYRLVGVDKEKMFKKITQALFVGAVIFGILHFTPYIMEDVIYTRFNTLHKQVVGPLYFLFSAYLLTGLIFAGLPLFRYLTSSLSPTQKIQSKYVLTSVIFGFIGITAFQLSFFGYDYPLIYYGCEWMVSFVFAYAIFKHDLIPIGVAVRRFLLILGLYTILIFSMIPVALLFFNQLQEGKIPSFFTLITLMVFIGLCFSFGPIAYNFLIKRLSIFQDELKSHFTHELKSPLSAIQSAQAVLDEEMLAEEPNKQKIADYMKMIDRNTHRLQHFVSEILELKKLSGLKPEKLRPTVSLPRLIGDLKDSFPSDWNRVQIFDDNQNEIKGDPEGLKHIFTNLLSNSFKFSPTGPIEMRFQNKGEHLLCSVKDYGKGIKTDRLKKIFDPFFKEESKTGNKIGSGLGLSIAKRWVENHQGRIWAESEGEGKGTRVSFTLPA